MGKPHETLVLGSDFDTRVQIEQLLHDFIGREGDCNHWHGSHVIDAHSTVKSINDAIFPVNNSQCCKHSAPKIQCIDKPSGQEAWQTLRVSHTQKRDISKKYFFELGVPRVTKLSQNTLFHNSTYTYMESIYTIKCMNDCKKQKHAECVKGYLRSIW